MQLAEQYCQREKANRTAAEQEVLRLLLHEDYSRAVLVVAEFEAAQVFARGLGIDWKNHNGTAHCEMLSAIFKTTPAILQGIDDIRLKQLRPFAGMMHLWGTGTARPWLPKAFDTGIHLDADTACRMLMFHAYHLRTLKGYQGGSITTVEVHGVDDSICCAECRKLRGREFPLEEVPELPYANCTSEIGCRCHLYPIIDYLKQ